MTCISVIKNNRGKLVMAGDRRLSFDWSQSHTMPSPKIRKDKSGVLLGAAGDGNLCNIIIDILDVPSLEGVKDSKIYMYYDFKRILHKTLIQQGYCDEHKLLNIPRDSECTALVGLKSRLYILDIRNPDPDVTERSLGLIEIEEAPLPFAIGCGAVSAIPILLAEKKRDGLMKKEHLKLAMEIASELSPGCDNKIDFIQED